MQAFNVEATREIDISPYNYTLVIVQFRNIELSKILSRILSSIVLRVYQFLSYETETEPFSREREANHLSLSSSGDLRYFSPLKQRKPSVSWEEIGCFSFRAAKWRVARTYTHKFRSQGDFTVSWEIRALIAAQSAAM